MYITLKKRNFRFKRKYSTEHFLVHILFRKIHETEILCRQEKQRCIEKALSKNQASKFCKLLKTWKRLKHTSTSLKHTYMILLLEYLEKKSVFERKVLELSSLLLKLF